MGAYSLGDFSAENSGRFIYYHAHNVILQYLWDWGVVGLALILIFLASLFFASKSLTPEGWFISAAIIFTGLIEVTLPNTLLSSKFVFILLLVKHIIPSDSVDQSRKRAESETS
jgi:O-antigen ligase